MSIGYKADMRGRGPANGDDVTTLLQNLPALPPLRAAQIKAVHTSVGPVDMACLADLEHSALGCEELTLRTGGWHPAVGKLKSLHVVVSKPSPETVGFLPHVGSKGYSMQHINLHALLKLGVLQPGGDPAAREG